jgi:sulfite reductase alpha subunit-like flavoprotein
MLVTAFSREEPPKVYVQDRLREYATEVNTILVAGGHF